MKLIKNILSLFKSRKPQQNAANVSVGSRAVGVSHSKNHLRTLYRVGPSYLTYRYPVDEKPLKEIYEKEGLIGPGRYSSEALRNMRDFDNFWFHTNEHERDMLAEDLLTLATKHKMYGAYSLLGAIVSEYRQILAFLKAGATKGSVECMVHYGISLYREGKIDEGFAWLKRGADGGDDLGCLYVGISYTYGTLSEVNYDLAAEYYLKAIEADEKQYWAYVNLGVLLVQGGYYHTALEYFEKAKDGITENYEEFNENRDADEFISDWHTCKKLLDYEYEERRNWYVVQAHSSQLDCIFCKNYEPIGKLDEMNFRNPKAWQPKDGQLSINPSDIEEISGAKPIGRAEVDRDEDYIFPTYHVKVNNMILYSGIKELVFIEKYCHAELNNYIKENIIQLRASFRNLGYMLMYLPAKSYGLNDMRDTIDSYVLREANVDPYFERYDRKIKENDYWKAIVDEGALPRDCAGFLRCLQEQKRGDVYKMFEFIQFPYRPGTDWQRAFSGLIDFMRHREIPADVNEVTTLPRKILPEGSTLTIDEEYEISLRSKEDEVLVKIELTPLQKVMLFALLNHPEGLVIKNLSEIKDELYSYYKAIMKGKGDASIKNIETMVDPTDNSANEKISRIRAAFKKAMESQYKDDLQLFLPQGRRGEAYRISWDRERVKYM